MARKARGRQKRKEPVHDPKLYYFRPYNFNHVKTHVVPRTFKSRYCPRIKCLCATKDFVYAFYRVIDDFKLRLARFCKATYIWEHIKTNVSHSDGPSICQFCHILWDGKTVLLFDNSALNCIDLETLVSTPVDHSTMAHSAAEQNGELVFNVDRNFVFEFVCAAVDTVNHCIYAQVVVQVTLDSTEIMIFRLNWETKVWSRINLKERDIELMQIATFMAYWEDHLYLGVPEYSNRLWNDRLVLNQVIRINLTTLDWDYHTPRPHVRRGHQYRPQPRDKVKWCQVGSVVYGIGSLRSPKFWTQDSSKTDFWSLHLPTLKWTRLQEARELKVPLKSFLTCATEDDIWVVQKEIHYQGHNAYQIPIALPRLHSLARSAFFYRPPNALVNTKRLRKTTNQQPLTMQRIKNLMHEHGQSSSILKLPGDLPPELSLAVQKTAERSAKMPPSTGQARRAPVRLLRWLGDSTLSNFEG